MFVAGSGRSLAADGARSANAVYLVDPVGPNNADWDVLIGAGDPFSDRAAAESVRALGVDVIGVRASAGEPRQGALWLRLGRSSAQGRLYGGDHDPLHFMDALEAVGRSLRLRTVDVDHGVAARSVRLPHAQTRWPSRRTSRLGDLRRGGAGATPPASGRLPAIVRQWCLSHPDEAVVWHSADPTFGGTVLQRTLNGVTHLRAHITGCRPDAFVRVLQRLAASRLEDAGDDHVVHIAAGLPWESPRARAVQERRLLDGDLGRRLGEVTRMATRIRVTRRHARAALGGHASPAPLTLVGVTEAVDSRARLRRVADQVLAASALVMAAPLWALIALAVAVDSRGGVLYRAVRVGLGGRPFVMLKFRTMTLHNDDSAFRARNTAEIADPSYVPEDGAYKVVDDPRTTRIGRVLRRTSLDELPQLLNVLRGDMALVGPRPSLLWETELYPPAARRRLDVLPGVTGPWQVDGRDEVSALEMLDSDLEYVSSNSLRGDLAILAATVSSVLGGRSGR